ncbi:hypothetical protein Ccrd_017145 [Cynara cardunculus var. scolymus]|uniref:Uncharacterized protein n=1 Tax=Cynara cardunculus var. scolymus TaxID=59895 RepID=A0A103Y8M1_CYNCS|nr:hypothetical protein Ccrd_017145 [Cynara cardunculus var. scolymus]
MSSSSTFNPASIVVFFNLQSCLHRHLLQPSRVILVAVSLYGFTVDRATLELIYQKLYEPLYSKIMLKPKLSNHADNGSEDGNHTQMMYAEDRKVDVGWLFMA